MEFEENEVSVSQTYSVLKGNIVASSGGKPTKYDIGRCILVPWFSSNEWKEVYENLFSDNFTKWKAAYCQMNVWKARCNFLPVGIESTIPLLHAMIAQAEKSMDDSFKDSIVNLAIVRFVSITSKGFEKTYRSKQSLHDLATRMNIPGFLVGLRNGIIHNDNISGSLITLGNALESCYSWIKKYYWDKEFTFHKIEENVDNERKICERLQSKRKTVEHFPSSAVKRKKFVDELEEDMSDGSDTEDRINHYKALEKNIYKFFKKILDGNVDEISERKNPPLFNSIKKYYELAPLECIQVIVDDVLCSKVITESINGFDDIKCYTELKVPNIFDTPILSLIGFLHEFRAIEKLIFALMRKAEVEEWSPLCFTWIRNLALTCNVKGKNWIEGVSYKQFHYSIQWNKIVLDLMSTTESKTIEFALELTQIMGVFSSRIDHRYKLRVKDFLKILTEAYLQNREEEPSPKSLKMKDGELDEILSVGDVLREARKSSKESLNYVEELTTFAIDAPVDDALSSVEDVHCRYNGTPLGVLSHQVGDPDFYKKLILDIPDS